VMKIFQYYNMQMTPLFSWREIFYFHEGRYLWAKWPERTTHFFCSICWSEGKLW
jgi:hypothetical protein